MYFWLSTIRSWIGMGRNTAWDAIAVVVLIS